MVKLFLFIATPWSPVDAIFCVGRLLSRSLDHVKIGDFGISKILSSKSKAFTVVGTPCYISPGQRGKVRVNHKVKVKVIASISKILSSKSKAFTVVGTPCYISPGQR